MKAYFAVNRFGLGPKEGELSKATINPQLLLKQQLTPITFEHSLPHSNEISLHLAQLRLKKKQAKKNSSIVLTQSEKKYPRKMYLQYASDTVLSAIHSNNSVAWRLFDFFSNHFSVSAKGPVMTALSGTLEREAIAPNLLGTFEQLLLSVIQHPAMLLYLNNEKSFGPNSKLGKRKGKNLNENLAREILELHTLGVNGGYTQQDVIELAKGLTGWSVANPLKDKQAGFIFRRYGHEPGARNLLGQTFNQLGEQQGLAMLKMLANHPNTVKHICFKLCHHFISDNVPNALVNKLINAWHQSNGNIATVMKALIDAKESWRFIREKFKTPREFVISTLRLTDVRLKNPKKLIRSLIELGQQPMKAGSPAGYSDEQADWDGASALMAKIDWTALVASRVKKPIKHLLMQLFGNNYQHVESTLLSKTTLKTIQRAESNTQAVALLLLSPEFLKR